MKGEKLSLLQRCIKWREANIKEKQFILILSFLVGIFTAFAALILKFFIHQIQNFLTNNFNATEANYLYLVYPVVGIFLAGWFVRNIVKDDISHGVTKILYAISRRQCRQQILSVSVRKSKLSSVFLQWMHPGSLQRQVSILKLLWNRS